MTNPTKGRKTTAKTADPKPAPAKIPQAHGGALNAGGTFGNKGGGRPPNAWKEAIRGLLEEPETLQTVKKILRSGSGKKKMSSIHPQFTSLYSKLAVHAHGIPDRAGHGDSDENQPSAVILDL